MSKYVNVGDRVWKEVDVRGVRMEGCELWEGKYAVSSGFFRMPRGMRIPMHHHAQWVQVLVMSGTMEVKAEGGESQTIEAGGYYFVEPGETHLETAIEDTLLLVISEESRG